MSEWKEYCLKEITSKIGSGATPKGGKESYYQSGISLIRSQNVLDFEFSINGLAFIDAKQAEELKNVVVKKNDILLNITGDSVARVCRVPDDILPARVNQHVSIIRIKEDVANSNFILYYLLNPICKRKLLQTASDGATRNALTKSHIENLSITMPSLSEQKQIADVLSCLDAKIENLRRQNETLEQIAQTLFKHWFIDFEFPFDFDQGKPKADGKPYKSSGGAMIASELGDIPAGWQVEKLGDFIDIQHGFNFKSEDFTDSGDIVVRMGNFLITGGLNFDKGKTKYFQGMVNKKFTLNAGDLVIALSDVTQNGLILGNAGIIPSNNQKYLLNQRVGKILIKNLLNKTFLYYLMSTKKYKHWIKNSANSTTVLNTSPTRIGEFNLFLPSSVYLINKFEEIASSLLKKKEINIAQIQTLTKTRDSLLPKLMSGQLRVKE